MLSAIVAGITYSLDSGTYCRYIDDDGLGMSPLHRISERGPMQHGDTDLDFRLDPRIIRLVLEIEGTSAHDLYDQRKALIGIFKPRKSPVILEWVLPNITTRRILANYISDMSLPNADRESFSQKVVVTLEANDPAFYDPTGLSIYFQLGGGGGDVCEVPTPIPMLVGASTLNASGDITYNGDWLEYPQVHIIGPITDPVVTITHGTTSEKLDFTGITIAAGAYYTIDCRYGYKTIVNSSGVNKIADLTNDSRLDDFHIEADPDAPGGLNTITVTGSAVTGATYVGMNYYERYLGL